MAEEAKVPEPPAPERLGRTPDNRDEQAFRPTPDGHRVTTTGAGHHQRYERRRRPGHTDDTAWRNADERVAALGHTSSLSYLFGEHQQAPKKTTTTWSGGQIVEEKEPLKPESGSVFDLGALYHSVSEAVGIGVVEEPPPIVVTEDKEPYDPETDPAATHEDAVPYWQAFDDPPPPPEEGEEAPEEEEDADEKYKWGFSLFGAEGDYGVGGDKEETFSLKPRFTDPDDARDHVLAADEPQPEFDEAGAALLKPALADDARPPLEDLVQHGLKYGVGQRLDHLDALDDQIAGIYAEPVVEATVLTPEEIRERHPSLIQPLAGTEFVLHPTQEEKDEERAAVVQAARDKGQEPPPEEDPPVVVPVRPPKRRHLVHRPSKYEGLMAGLDREGGSYAAKQESVANDPAEAPAPAVAPGDGEPAGQPRSKHEPRGKPGRVLFAAALSRQQLESIAEHKRQDIIVEDSPKSPARGIVVEKAEEKEAFDRAVAEGTVASSVFPAASQRGMDSSAEIAALWPTADAAKDEGAADDATKASDDGSKRKKKKKPKAIQEEGGEETKKKRRDRAGTSARLQDFFARRSFPPARRWPRRDDRSQAPQEEEEGRRRRQRRADEEEEEVAVAARVDKSLDREGRAGRAADAAVRVELRARGRAAGGQRRRLRGHVRRGVAAASRRRRDVVAAASRRRRGGDATV